MWFALQACALSSILALSAGFVATEPGSAAANGLPRGCNVLHWGALGDGKHDDTLAMQSCFDSCAEGRVTVPAGTYLVAQLAMRGTSLHVHLQPGAVLLASADRTTYTGPQGSWYALVMDGCHHCSLSGAGAASVVDGGADRWVLGTIPVRFPLPQQPLSV